MAVKVPPNGFVGAAQQTVATQVNWGMAQPVRKKRKTKKKTAKKKTRPRGRPAAKKKTRKRSGRLVKGSAAAKKRMAELRAMQKKKRR